MDGEKKLVIISLSAGAVCLTVLYSFLFIALWDYRQFVGLSLVAVFLAVVWVYIRGRLNEQDLRTVRYRHHEETPLDEKGEPFFYREGWQANPHRR
jgi:hypothetical protein